MFYIVKTECVGPNQSDDRYADADKIEIRDTTATTNISHEPRIEGWCGTTNDWAVYAHGEFDTIEAARAAINEKFGDVREIDFSCYGYNPLDDGIIQAFKLGKYEPMSRSATADWIYDLIENDITDITTDDRIAELAVDYEIIANENGYTLDRHLIDIMNDYRDELREQQENEV